MRIVAALWLALLASSAPLHAQAQAEPACGHLANPYGPFDYRKERGKALGIVDGMHFNSDVRNLRRGQSGTLGGDLDYVLRAAPNHHMALASVSEWGVRLKTRQPPSLPRSIDCYFDRAIRFQPDDYLVWLIYGSFLQRMNLKSEALAIISPLESKGDLEAFTHQNLGMLLLDLNEPERALAQAWKAEAMGWQRPGLKERLQQAGQWREPPPAAAASAASAASAAQAPASAPTTP